MLTKLLEKLEWASWAEAEPLSHLERGEYKVRTCPCCGGIHPEEGASRFIPQALGHREGCELFYGIRSEKLKADTASKDAPGQKLTLELTHVSDDMDYKLKRPVFITVSQKEQGEEIQIAVDGSPTMSICVNNDGEVWLTLPGGNENKKLLLAKGEVFQANYPLEDMEEGQVLDVGEGCFYDIRSIEERGGSTHLILEGDDGVWHLKQEAGTQLVPSQTQDGLWALPESAVGTPKLKQIY